MNLIPAESFLGGCRINPVSGETSGEARSGGIGLELDMGSGTVQLKPARNKIQWPPAKNFSASSAAMQPIPAAVTAWRKILSLTSPAAKTPGTLVFVESGAVR